MMVAKRQRAMPRSAGSLKAAVFASLGRREG
jgi:hypothetical protein